MTIVVGGLHFGGRLVYADSSNSGIGCASHHIFRISGDFFVHFDGGF
jgi:hypothetical protein